MFTRSRACFMRLKRSDSSSACPVCLKKGKLVDTLTLKAFLDVPLTEIRYAGYRFCSTADCPVVYYSQDGAQIFREIHLRERVYQKHTTEDEVFICYCFRHSIGYIKEEFILKQADNIVASINSGIQAGQCACEIRNPQGSCCLGDVRVFIKNLEVQQV